MNDERSNDLRRRRAVFAGTFYPDDPDRCRAEARRYVSGDPAGGGRQRSAEAADRHWRGAIVPHAGWICSAAIAGQSIAALATAGGENEAAAPKIVVVFGAIHTPLPADRALLCSTDVWETPSGDVAIAGEVRDALAQQPALFAIDDRFHGREHAIEVELPLVQAAWPNAMVLPVEVPPTEIGVAVGQAVAAELRRRELSAVYLASSDLTHYGPDYRFTPAGVGIEGLDWAKQNDRRLLEKVLSLSPAEVVEEARNNRNACGPGAIAAMLSACLAEGSNTALLLCHANSYETLADVRPQPPTDAVGYAAVVVG